MKTMSKNKNSRCPVLSNFQFLYCGYTTRWIRGADLSPGGVKDDFHLVFAQGTRLSMFTFGDNRTSMKLHVPGANISDLH